MQRTILTRGIFVRLWLRSRGVLTISAANRLLRSVSTPTKTSRTCALS